MSLHEIEGIGPTYAAKLEPHGLTRIEHLLEQGGTAAGRKALAEKSGISEQLIPEWVNHADLNRVDGVGGEYADLLEAAGVDSVPELVVRRVPTEGEVERWIEHAKTLPPVVQH